MDSDSLLAKVWEGLSRPYGQKCIPSLYFYDDRGSQLYTQLGNTEEYYITRCEKSILRDPYTAQSMQKLLSYPSRLTLVDLGAGDGQKTLEFLEQWCIQAEASGHSGTIQYIPIDFSSEACSQVAEAFESSNLKQANKWTVTCQPVVGDSLAELAKFRRHHSAPICVFILGTTLSNYDYEEGMDWLRQLRKCLIPGDILLMGLDLLKSPSVLIPAYSDSHGICEEFDFNLVRRLNKDFGIPWNPSDFEHYAFYNPRTHSVETYLVSRKAQTFKTINLAENEMIHTDYSNKYRLEDLRNMAESTGFQLITDFLDDKKYYVDTVWKAQ